MSESKSLIQLKNHLATSQGHGSAMSLSERKVALAQARERNILLLDTSGSMSEPASASLTRMQALWNIVQEMRSKNIPFRICEFNDLPQWSDGVTMPIPSSMTDLAYALRFIAQAKPDNVTIITDGYPNDPNDALQAASSLSCPINVLYVGPDEPSCYPAMEFCRQLASASNGQYAKHSMASEQLLIATRQDVERLLLPPATREKTIQL